MLAVAFLLGMSFLSSFGCSNSALSGQERGSTRTEKLVDSIPAGQPFQRYVVDLDGLHLSILEAGTGDPVIFVHGVVTTSNIFSKYLSAYSPDFRGIADDLRG